jgi:hypothetical protein
MVPVVGLDQIFEMTQIWHNSSAAVTYINAAMTMALSGLTP